MKNNGSEWDALRTAALPIVEEAARRIRSYSGKLSVKEKSPHDYVTEIDVEIEGFVRQSLTELFPGQRFVGEESFHELDNLQGPIWVVDPLDGTSNVVFGLPPRCISPALLMDGEPVVGAICDPINNELFEASLGQGARLNGEPLRLGPATSSPAPLGASSGFLVWCENAAESPLNGLIQKLGRIRILGSQALQLCYVAAGRLSANVSREAKLWDDAAGALIVTEAGGWYGGFDGFPIFPVQAGTPPAKGSPLNSLATAPGLQAEIFDLLNYP